MSCSQNRVKCLLDRRFKLSTLIHLIGSLSVTVRLIRTLQLLIQQKQGAELGTQRFLLINRNSLLHLFLRYFYLLKDEYVSLQYKWFAICETLFSGLLPHPTSVVFTLGATLEAPALELGTTTLEEWEVTILIALKLVLMFMPQGNLTLNFDACKTAKHVSWRRGQKFCFHRYLPLNPGACWCCLKT